MIVTLNRMRVTTLALSTAAFIAVSALAMAQDADRPSLDVPYVPTPPEVVEKMLQMAEVKAGDYVIDLGCGDGRIAIAAAKRGAKALGVDIDPRRIEDANENAKKEGMTGKVSFRRQNLFETEIDEANVITMYLLTHGQPEAEASAPGAEARHARRLARLRARRLARPMKPRRSASGMRFSGSYPRRSAGAGSSKAAGCAGRSIWIRPTSA